MDRVVRSSRLSQRSSESTSERYDSGSGGYQRETSRDSSSSSFYDSGGSSYGSRRSAEDRTSRNDLDLDRGRRSSCDRVSHATSRVNRFRDDSTKGAEDVLNRLDTDTRRKVDSFFNDDLGTRTRRRKGSDDFLSVSMKDTTAGTRSQSTDTLMKQMESDMFDGLTHRKSIRRYAGSVRSNIGDESNGSVLHRFSEPQEQRGFRKDISKRSEYSKISSKAKTEVDGHTDFNRQSDVISSENRFESWRKSRSFSNDDSSSELKRKEVPRCRVVPIKHSNEDQKHRTMSSDVEDRSSRSTVHRGSFSRHSSTASEDLRSVASSLGGGGAGVGFSVEELSSHPWDEMRRPSSTNFQRTGSNQSGLVEEAVTDDACSEASSYTIPTPASTRRCINIVEQETLYFAEEDEEEYDDAVGNSAKRLYSHVEETRDLPSNNPLGSPFDPTSNPRRRYGMSSTNEKTSVTDNYINESPCLYSQIDSQSERTVNGREERSDDVNNGCGASNKHQGDKSKHQKEYLRDSVSSPSHNDRDRNSDRCAVDVSISEEFKEDSYKSREINSEKVSKTNISQKNNTDVREDVVNPDQQVMRETSSKVDNKRSYDSDGRFSTVSTEEIADLPTHTSVRPDDIDSCTIVKTSTEIGSAKSDEMVDLTCRRDWANASPSRSHVSFDIDHREDISKTGLYETTEETHSHVIQIYEGSHGTSEGEEEDFSGRKVDHVMNVSVGVENGVAVTANFSIQLDLEVTENGENEGGDVENAAKIELETIVSDDDTTDGTILEETELTVTSYDRSAEQNGQSACDINVSVTVGELADTALNGLGDQELHNTNNNMHVDDNECHVSDLKRPFTVESTHVKDRKQEDSSGVEDYSIEVKCNDQSGTAVDFWSIIADNEGNSGCAEQCDHVKFTRNDVLSDSSDDTLVTEDVRDSKNQLLILKTTIDDFSSNNVDQTTRIDIEVQSSLQVGTHMVDGEDNFNTPSSYKLELVADKSDNSNRLKSCSGVQCVDNAAVEEPAVIDADVGDMAVVDTTVEKEVVVGAVVEEEADAIVEDMTAVDADFVEAADTDVFVEEKAVVDTDVEVVNIDASVEEDTIVDASVEAEAAVDADVEEDAAIDADVEEEGAVNAGVEEQAVVDAAIEEVVNIDASVEEYTIVDASVEAEAAVDADVEEEAAIDADVEEEAAVNADVEEFANIDAFVEEEAVVDADVEEVEAVDAVVEEVAAVDAAVEEEAAVDAEVEEAAAVGATVGDSEVVDVTAEGSIVVDAAVEDVTAVDADVEDVEDVDGVESLKTSELRINDIDYWTSENSNRMKLGDRRSQSIHENTVSASCDKSYSQDMPTRPNVDEQSSLEPCHVSSSDRFPHPNEKRNSLEMAHESPPKPSLSYEGTRRFLSKDASKFAELFGKTVDSEGISGLTQSLDSDGESDGNDKVDDVSETLLVDNGSEVKDEVEQVGMTTSPAKTDLEVHECITTKTDITGDDNILHKMLPSHDSDVGGDDLDASEFEIEDCTYACKPNILNQTSSHVEADNVTPQGKPLLGSESTPSEWGDDNDHSLQDLSEAPVDAKSNYLASTAELSADESTISTRLSDKIDLKYVSESPSSNFERFSADNDVKTHSSTSEEISVQSTIDSVVESPIAAVIQAESQETPADVEVKSPEYHQSAVTSNDNDPDSRVRHSLDESSDEEETEKNAPTSPSDTNIALPELSTDGAQLDLVTPLRQALHTEDVNSALTVTVEGKAKVTAPGILNIEKLTSERDGCFLPRHYQLQCPCPAKTSSEILEGLMTDGAWITVRPDAPLQIHADEDDSAKPQILTKFTDLICFITENKILTVQGYGNPIPEPHWHMDGAEIHSSEDYVIQQDKHQYRLIIPRVRYEDAGQYKLALKNHMGQAEEQCKLVVKPLSELKEPHFFTHIFDDTKKKGDEVTLSMEIRGNPQPDIKWFKDDVELAPDTNIMMTYDLESCVYTLKIRRISDGDMGTYVCRATNEYGTEQEQARIDVIFKPEISGLREIPVVPGEGATLHATIKSNPKCRLKWQHDQKDLKSSHNVIITTNEENTETSVQILTVGMYDGGIYSVVAENTQGETISNGLILLRTALPTFKKRLLNTGARLGDRLRLEAVITGLPVPDVSWFKEDAPLQVERIDEDTYRFMVDEVTSPDYGQYRIVAMNCVGSSECCCDVTEVVLPPVIETRLPTFHKMDEAETLVLEVKTDGNPPPEVCWMLDNEPLQLSDRVRAVQLQDGVCQLTVEDLRPEDAGRYRLVASNGNGDAATETAVTVDRVLSKPRFENILDDVEVTAGRPLKLETRVLGYPKPGVKWLKNGVPLHSSEHISITNTPQGTSILDIENATLEDSGAYSVIAVNDLGEESLDADVVVEPARKKPCLLEALTAVRAVEGYPPRVEGRFSGVPAPLVSWFRDGEPVDLGSSRAKPYTLPDGTFGLLLPCCEQEDSGVYKACVANLVGRLQTETKLDVIAKQRPGPEMAPQFSSTLRDTEVNEGSQLLLTAEVTGNPLPDVCWSKDNVPLDTGDERVFTGYDGDKVTLSVRPSRVRDAGRYHVVLSSKLGQADASCVVRVKKTYQAPHFAQKVTDIQQVPGFDGKFLGRVSGTPRPDVEWLCNDMPIEASSKKYRIKRDADMCGLHVIDCEMRDAGIYTCVARNVDGEARCSAHLDVVEKIERRVRSEAPFFLKTIAPCEVFPGMQGKFTACVAGSPEPQYEWYKNDVIILPSDRVLMETDGCGLIRLVIKHADDADSGRYRLKIYNTHGDAACEADLFYDTLDGGFGFGSRDHNQTVDRQMRTGIPVPLCDRPLISRMNDRQLTLSWHPSPTAGHHMPVTYHVEMAEMPRGDWFSVRTGVRGCSVEVRNLEPHRDYRFRVKVENKHGTSDASPYVVTQRERFVPEGGSAFSYLPDGEVFKSDLSSHFPRDFDMDKWSAGRGCPPTFLPHPSLTQYGVRGHSESLHWLLYGSPKPDVSFTYNGKPLELGGRYCCSYPSNGECTLFINKLQDRDQGYYELLARNPHGEIRQRVNLQMARHPYFLQSPTPVCALQHEEVRLVARAAGMPAPTLRWFRDWLPLVPSDRVRVVSPQEDTSILLLHSCVARDAGLYTVTATNAAGTATTSAYLRVEQDEALYSYLSYSPSRCIRPKSRAFEDFYLIGDELGRGTQGVIYHVSERGRGGNFAAKCMSGTGELRQMMSAEMWAMGQLCDRRLARLYDAYQSDSQLVLVQELCSGGELLETMCRRDVYTEVDVAGVIRQVLLGLRHMHGKHIGHLGLTPGDILFSRPAGSDIQITDFSLSRHINPHRPERLAYGMPEFVAPEIVNNEVVGLPADMWSVGIITYLLLSGISPFRGETDRETLKKIQSGEMSYDLESFRGISDEAKDFISRMLVFSAEGRLDVEAALKHPWMSFADRSSEGLHEISTTRLGLYLDTYRSWYRNTLCRTWFRRRPLASAFTHPSCMVYPPDGEVYTPPLSQRHVSGASNKSQRRRHHGSCHGDETDAKRHHSGDDEIGWVQTESHYQQGPETYLLQLRDTGLPSRLRRYMKVARERSALYSRKSSEDPLFDRTLPMIHERRRFTDIMDEEIDDERRRRIGGYDVDRHVPRRLRYEMASNGTVLLEPQHTTGPRRSGAFPFFREKPSDVSYREGDVCKMSCLAVGTPKPIIQWFRNDLVIGDSRRIRVEEEESGRSSITFEPAKNFDQGVYKVVARNSTGQAVAKCRLFVGSVPGLVEIPEPVEHTDTEVLLRWRMPQDSGHPPVVAYSLQMKHLADHEWIEVADNIDHEFFVVHGLEPESTYHFRLRARNQLGWGQYNTPSPIVHMHKAGWSQKIQVSKAEKYQQRVTESGRVPPELSVSRPIDYTTEDEPIPAQHVSPELKYNFLSEISRGRFSVVAECLENSTQTVRAAKILQISDETREAAAAEMKMLSSLRHERIATLFEFYDLGTRCVLILERLQGLDVLNYFQLRHEYNEDMVVIVISQVLDALQYLHWRGIAHLNLQPDNIVLTSCRRPDVKLVDLGSARRIRHVTGADSPAPPCAAITGSYLEFAAPELICGESEAIGGSADVWSLGAITYLLLSGVSPFLAASDAETRLNILHVHFRYEHLYPEITTEATRFVMFIFKRAAGKRPSCEECEEHRWMMSNEYMQKQRQRAVFLGNRLREYSERYHGSRQELATQDTTLTSCLGMDLSKSLSVENSEYTTV